MDKEHYKELSARAADGDAKAFSMLYEMLYREMYYTAYYSLADDKDAVAAVIGAARDGFNSISKLRTEDAFEMFMMKTLCARIRTRCREYEDDDRPSAEAPDIKRKMWKLSPLDRICATLFVAARLEPGVIAAYTGITRAGVKKRLETAARVLDLDVKL